MLYVCSFYWKNLQGNAFWRLVRNLLKTPSAEQNKCQHPKPILLDTGEMKVPYDWAVSSFLLCHLLNISARRGSLATNSYMFFFLKFLLVEYLNLFFRKSVPIEENVIRNLKCV